jgi:non-homologous end joining protein Ku
MKSQKDKRVYFENSEFIIFENQCSSTPILISHKHSSSIPIEAFVELKKICCKLFGNNYCFNPTKLSDNHYQIKTIRF